MAAGAAQGPALPSPRGRRPTGTTGPAGPVAEAPFVAPVQPPSVACRTSGLVLSLPLGWTQGRPPGASDRPHRLRGAAGWPEAVPPLARAPGAAPHTLSVHPTVNRLTPRRGMGCRVRHPDGDVRAGSSAVGSSSGCPGQAGGPHRPCGGLRRSAWASACSPPAPTLPPLPFLISFQFLFIPFVFYKYRRGHTEDPVLLRF